MLVAVRVVVGWGSVDSISVLDNDAGNGGG